VGGGDGHDDRGGAISKEPAHAVLVHDLRAAPRQAVAGLDHGAGQAHRLVEIELGAGAGGDERGDVQVRATPAHDVTDDGSHGLEPQALAVHLPPQVGE
jgi:hypothetical protein